MAILGAFTTLGGEPNVSNVNHRLGQSSETNAEQFDFSQWISLISEFYETKTEIIAIKFKVVYFDLQYGIEQTYHVLSK